MFRELTYSDVSRAKALANAEVSFVMDEEAFRGFYDRNARGLWAYLSRVTGDRQLADDLLQEAFYRFLRAASNAGGEDRFDSDAHRRNSLYRIATNLAVDARRRSFTRPAASVTGDDVERVASSGRSGDHGEDAARRADVNRAMAQLRPRDRAMLWMAYAEGASHDEIAGAIGVQPSSMKLLLFRARKKMAKLLGEKGGGQ
ncbi:MAG TPA: sigma-70 family RNA polymerase sigma factor [Bryobacteraceae bacterium]|nr:sigma-70 family RNA polymerase sigma factor [Bryobacteraceae bacterium]